MKHLAFIIVIICLGAIACRTSNVVPQGSATSVDTPGPAIQLSGFPLNAGNMWVYDDGDTLRVMGDTMINNTTVTKLTKTNAHYTYSVYCKNMPDGLYMLASTNQSAFQSLLGQALDTYPTLYIADTPVQFTKLPANFINSWVAHVPNMKYSNRQWKGYATVTTSAGTFNCIKLSNGHVDEYYSEKGIVKFSNQPNCFTTPCPPIVTRLVYVNF